MASEWRTISGIQRELRTGRPREAARARWNGNDDDDDDDDGRHYRHQHDEENERVSAFLPYTGSIDYRHPIRRNTPPAPEAAELWQSSGALLRIPRIEFRAAVHASSLLLPRMINDGLLIIRS